MVRGKTERYKCSNCDSLLWLLCCRTQQESTIQGRRNSTTKRIKDLFYCWSCNKIIKNEEVKEDERRKENGSTRESNFRPIRKVV